MSITSSDEISPGQPLAADAPAASPRPRTPECVAPLPGPAAVAPRGDEAAASAPGVRPREPAPPDDELYIRMLVEGIAQATWETDGAGRVVNDSPSWRAYTGQSLAHWLGHGWVEALHPEDRAFAARRWQEAVETGRGLDAEYRLWHAAAGDYRWTNVRAVPVFDRDGAVRKWLGMNIDVHDRREAAARLQEREADLARVQRIGQVGGVNIDVVNGLCSWRSPEYLRLHGLPPGARLESHAHWRARVHPEDRERAEETLLQALRGNASSYDSEYRIVRPVDGQVRWIHARADIERDADGQPLRLVGAHVDITEQKQLQEALQEADRRKDAFLAMLAHELRNPLATISNGLHVLARGGDDAALLAQVLGMMRRQTGHLVRLVDDLMDVSRITQGKIRLQKSRVEVGALMHTAIEASRGLIDARGHRLRVAPPPREIVLHADPLRLAQILSNLLNNAAKYTDPGGDIVLQAREEGGAAVFVVRDTGIGIAPEMLARVFDLFAQVEHDAGRDHGGLGIGLTLVRDLAELHGGSVAAHSEGLGRGSTFVVRIPLSEAPGDILPPRTTPSPPATAPRVLIVDDDRDAADSLALWLQDHGVAVHTAYDGNAALELLARHRPDLMIVDIGMPGMGGLTLARRVRAMEAGKTVLLAALSGWGQAPDRARSREAGFDHHLLKPVDLGVLDQLIASATAAPGEAH